VLVFDIEADGLIDDITKIYCINIIDLNTDEEYRYTDYSHYQDLAGGFTEEPTARTGTICDGLKHLASGDVLAGHNIINYDIPAIKAVYPDWKPKDGVSIRDTLVMSRVMYANLKDLDFAMRRRGRLSDAFFGKGLAGSHKLEAWGMRLGGPLKDDFSPDHYINPRTGKKYTWKTVPFIKDMDEYCMQDVRTSVYVLKHFDGKNYSEECLSIEHAVASIITRQERNGWLFDVEAAERLTKELQLKKLELEQILRETFPPFYVRVGSKPFIPKRDNARLGYTTGCPMTKLKLVEFNPGSRDHIADRLIKLFKWKPDEFTESGKPKVDETVLSSLPWDEAKLLSEYLMVEKRLGQVAEGTQAWLKVVKPNSRIHGRVNPNGAVTGRMTHFEPNIAQVPASRAPYGEACRRLFTVPTGKKLVGCDAEGLELRLLAHYMAKWDNGDYVRAVTEGNKEDGTDAHTLNQKALGFNSRDNAKTWFYAMIYGAGNHKLGRIALGDLSEEGRKRFYETYPKGKKRDAAIARMGKKTRDNVAKNLPALGNFIEAVKKAARRGYLIGLDGRHIHIRSEHSAPNALLQSGGAVVMKKALIILDDLLQRVGLTPGEEYEFCGNIHDEFQMEVDEDVAEFVGRMAAASIREAGRHFNLRCPLAGDYAIGTSWAETH